MPRIHVIVLQGWFIAKTCENTKGTHQQEEKRREICPLTAEKTPNPLRPSGLLGYAQKHP
jgi:hypothetical protein